MSHAKQKSAIRQLINEIKLVAELWDDPANEVDGVHCFKILLNRAKELEAVNEQQMIDAYNKGIFYRYQNVKLQQSTPPDNGDQYFNETFEKL